MLLFHVILILFTLVMWCYYIILYSSQYIGWLTALRLPSRSLIFSFSMPATRPSTRIQRRAQATSQSGQSSRRRRTTTPQRQATYAVSPDGATPTEGAWSTSINDATFERIVSAVSQAVLSSLNEASTSNQPPPSLAAAEAPTDLVEMPVVESGSDPCAPVASALSNVIGGAIQVSPSSQPALPTFHSLDVPIDANVSSKIKCKIWAHEFIDLGILLTSGSGDTRYHLSVSSPHGSSLPTLAIEPSHKPKAISNIELWTTAFQIFVGVYTAKFLLDALALMKYSEVVREVGLHVGRIGVFMTLNFGFCASLTLLNSPGVNALGTMDPCPKL